MIASNRSTLKTLGVAALGAAALAAAALLRPSLVAQRREALGPVAPAPLPPQVAVAGTFLGAFRGLVVDYLWLRAMRLSDEGKYFEAHDIAQAIGTLQPRLEQVWGFQAHGLAYNLSAACDTAEQRWHWVQSGIALLRDQGIPLNPNAPELHFMLSRIYSDKIGGPFDDFHLELKARFASSQAPGFGAPGEDPDLAGIAAAPPVLDAEASALLGELRGLGLALAADGRDLEGALLRSTGAGRAAFAKALEGRAPDGAEVGPARAATARRVRAHARATWMRSQGLDPARVLEVDERYGPLDWHVAYAHALYWGSQGVAAARKLGPKRALREERRLSRRALEALRNAMRQGRLILQDDGNVFFAPEPRLVGRVLATFDGLLEQARADEARGVEVEPDEDDENKDPSARAHRIGVENAREHFCIEAILLLAQYGRDADARRLFARFAKEHPQAAPRPYDEFLGDMIRNDILEAGNLNQATATRALTGAWICVFEDLARGDDERAVGRVALADRIHREWRKIVAEAVAKGDAGASRRLGGVDLPRIKQDALETARKRLSPPLRARLDERAGALLSKPGEKPATGEKPPGGEKPPSGEKRGGE